MMKKRVNYLLVLFTTLTIGFTYGYFVHRDKIFPYGVIKKAYLLSMYNRQMAWSIGIYKGESPFTLSETKDAENPVISAKDVTDVDAAFVADPFILQKDGNYYMFFEVLNLETNSGDIGYATSKDGKTWDYQKIVLDEQFHLSYPCIFEWEGKYYMIPESSKDFSVRLYSSSSFPEDWEFAGTLLSGEGFTDPTLFHHENKWWMFCSNNQNGSLSLFFSDSLTHGWKSHPMNPLIVNDKHISRSAGRVFTYDQKLYRLAQDDYPSYGLKVYAIEITELTENTYNESSTLINVVSMTGKGWNGEGMHHVDMFQSEEEWIGIVDGRKRWP